MAVKYLLNVNEDILPISIKSEFNKIRLEFKGGNNNTNVIIPVFKKLHELQSKGLLFENENDNDDDGIFVKLTNEKLSLFTKEYHKGFKEGYENNNYLNIDFVDNSDNKIKINRVFAEVYEKFNKLDFHLIDIENIGLLCIKLHFYEFGVEVGIFTKCWDIILNNYFLFEEIFNKYYNKHEENIPEKQTKTLNESEPPQENILTKPTIKPEEIERLFEILKDFFSYEQQNALLLLLETGENVGEKLVFKTNGNRLTDTFKKLIEYEIITGCQKKDLIDWIILHFNFTHQNTVKKFIYDTVEKIISRNDSPCKSPLIQIINGQVKKIEQPRIKNTTKY
jgi:hypothetical protein